MTARANAYPVLWAQVTFIKQKLSSLAPNGNPEDDLSNVVIATVDAFQVFPQLDCQQ